ncbi:MAG: ferrous iron transport protein A [Anaerolineales bacterium]|jgi:ferrous iron transport protein A
MTLLQVETGKLVRVLNFTGGTGLEYKLRQLGLLPGDYARVLRLAPLGGPILIDVGGRSIALGRGIASKVEVEDAGCDLP